jgi:hypothetical protein
VSSIATVIGASAASRWVTINSASSNPTCRGHHRAAEKNRCARPWCHIRARPAPVSIPHTVRPAGCANSPATSIVNVWKVGAVKHGRKVTSTRVSAPGRGEDPEHRRNTLSFTAELLLGTADAPPITHHPAKINTARRGSAGIPITARATPDHHCPTGLTPKV